MPEVFVSYSWGVEHDTGIVDDLEKQFRQRGMRLIRDENTIKHGERISKFMERITGASHVITVFSKPYFQSEYCLFELMNVLQYKGLEQQIYPILADDLKISDLATRRGFVKFWNDKVEAELQAVSDIDAGDAPGQHKQLNLYKEFAIKIDGLMARVGDILATQAETLKAKRYAGILDLICPMYQVPPTAIFHPEQSDLDFMATIRLKMQEALFASLILRKAIAEQLKLKGTDEIADKLVNILVERCDDEDALGCLLRNDVFRATRLSLQALSGRLDNDSAAVIKEVDQLTNSADTLFSCLVLYAIL